MKSIDETINEFKSLNLSEYPIDKIKSLIAEFGEFGLVIVNLHKGKVIFRARPTNGKTFSKISDLSYVRSEANKSFKRASSPDNTMFYGSVLPEGVESESYADVRVVGAFECTPFLRNTSLDGEQELAYGKWIVTEDIPLLAIVQHKDFLAKTEYIEGMNEGFQEFIKANPEQEEKTVKVLEYLASDFAKESTDNEYDYLISALFTEATIEQGLAGILYPSVRAAGEGFNVAIHPSFVDTSMELESVGVCTIYKKGKKTVVDNETFAFIEEGKSSFTLKQVDSKNHTGRENVIKFLNS